MVSSNRKARKLPLNFFEEVYNAMDMWLCQRSSINPSYTVSDTSVLPSAQGQPAVEEENVEESEDNAAGYSPPSSINNGNEYSNGRKRQRTPRGSEGLISVMLKSEEAKEWWGKQEAIAMEARKVSYEIAMEGRKMTYNIHRDNSLQRDRAIEVAATAANALVNIGSGLTYLAHTLNMSMTQGCGVAPGQFNGRHDPNGTTSSQPR